MSTYSKKPDFFESEEGKEAERMLKSMALDKTFHTESSYSANAMLYPDNKIPFVKKHMEYLRSHPSTDPMHYISNLRLMTRKKSKL
jgi:hypothetical protein